MRDSLGSPITAMHPEDQAIADSWVIASADLGIRVTSPFNFHSPIGETFECILLIHGFGSPAGTVIGTLNEPFDEFFAAAQAAGYYASALNPSSYGRYDRAHFIDTLQDWAWQELEVAPPSWYQKPP